jgi:hypothetical protein
VKVTGWYQPQQKPVRRGVYERWYNFNDHKLLMLYSFWNGIDFGYGCGTPKAAKQKRGMKSPEQNLRWRGIAKE